MDLDNTSNFPRIDAQDMLSHIEGLPGQLQTAWKLGQRSPLPAWEGIERVLVAGMGGSAIGADLAAAYLAPHLPVPLVVHRNYTLPAWAKGARTLVIACSHSGDTEESLTAFESATAHECRTLAITTGGKLGQASQNAGAPLWQYEYEGQPRAAVGFLFGLLLAALTRLGMASNPERELQEAIQAMRAQQQGLRVDVPVVNNFAKRMAGQLYGRLITVFGADILEPVARRWKSQINEIAKAWGQFEPLPEADHNTLAGSTNPEEILARLMALFLRASSSHPRNQLRTNLTKQAFMLAGLNTDFIDAQGASPLAHQWTMLHLGDYTAYYLAMAYGVDPTPVEAIQGFKQEMSGLT